MKKFLLSNSHDWLGGVCAGLAYAIGIPIWIVRVIWIFTVWYYGTGIFVYIVLTLVVDEWKEDPPDFEERIGLG